MSGARLPGYEADDVERRASEPIKETVRSPFARDRARVLHSAALRRLAAKTQVMVAGSDDFPRTRLTHTLEVAQIARELGESLGCDPDVVDVAGLAHDVGHPPFGHNGEEALDAIAANIGGFEGNAQTLRVLTRLEAKEWDVEADCSVGLNLTRAVLDASCKYPWSRRPGERKFGYYSDDADTFNWIRHGAPEDATCIEEQVMDWSDDVAYSVHDVEDAVHLGLVDLPSLRIRETRDELVRIAQERYLPEASSDELLEALDRLIALPHWPNGFTGSHRDVSRLKRFTSHLIGRFSVSAQIATQLAYGDSPLTRYNAKLEVPIEVRLEVAVMKAITVRFVMYREGAEVMYTQQRELIGELVEALLAGDGRFLDPWLLQDFARATSDGERLRIVVDQVASLTDLSVVHWHELLVR